MSKSGMLKRDVFLPDAAAGYGCLLFDYLQYTGKMFFKYKHIYTHLPLKLYQFNLAVRWLRDNGFIEKHGGTNSCWMVIR